MVLSSGKECRDGGSENPVRRRFFATGSSRYVQRIDSRLLQREGRKRRWTRRILRDGHLLHFKTPTSPATPMEKYSPNDKLSNNTQVARHSETQV